MVISTKRQDYYSHVAGLPWLQQRLALVIGEFADSETLREGLCWRPQKANSHDQRLWIEASFAAYKEPNPSYFNDLNEAWDTSDPVIKATAEDAFHYFSRRVEKALIIGRDVQEGIRERLRNGNPTRDKLGVLPAFAFGGIIPYNHSLLRQAAEADEIQGLAPVQRRLLSIVVDERLSSGNINDIVSAEFSDGADVVMTGRRLPEDYRNLLLAWFSGTVNPARFGNARFNEGRFTQMNGGLLSPKHEYKKPEIGDHAARYATMR